MKLSQVLAQIKQPDSVKTAAASSATETPAADKSNDKSAATDTAERLRAALKEATVTPTQPIEKNASTASPTGDLAKIASDVANAEHEAIIKEAQTYGAAVADGFMIRLAMYNEAATKLAAEMPNAAPAPTKVATPAEDGFEKFATENPGLVKDAFNLGFERTTLQMEKLGEAAFTKGYNDTVEAIYKTAHVNFINGYEDAARLLEEIAR